MDRLHLCIVTSDGERWEHMVSSVTLPTDFGSVGVLAGHAPMLCAVARGTVKCRFGEGESARIAISAGIANVADNELTLLVSDLRAACEN